ncbi:MAG: ADP-forming succinate--CoA ligase subunit beta [Candidatus Krumholzibacteria bacterium]|nr:ADP-forming succinate--CoA ligase subunit beta [Candidatus Krumholzibacteria bacterium]
MKIHESDARAIFTRFGLPVPPSRLVADPRAAEAAAEELGCPVVVKAQVLVGGRGKAGGVKLASSPREAGEKAGTILGMEIKGLAVEKVLVARAVDIVKEFYAAMVFDRVTRRPMMMVSPSGGVDIEEVARTAPERILKLPLNPEGGLMPFQTRRLTSFLTGDRAVAKQIGAVLQALYDAFMGVDASLAEINPLVLSQDGTVWAIDAKINIDDNGLFRHPEIEALRDTADEDPGETAAREAGLSFVKLDGSIGCVVNGAGLAMATMDMIKHYGAEPANFLDIGGSSSPDKVLAAMRIILRDPSVKAILINIFGGITRCDDVAMGLIEAKKRLGLDVPLVVRLTGTNAREAGELLAGTDLIGAETMDEAVKGAIAAARG